MLHLLSQIENWSVGLIVLFRFQNIGKKSFFLRFLQVLAWENVSMGEIFSVGWGVMFLVQTLLDIQPSLGTQPCYKASRGFLWFNLNNRRHCISESVLMRVVQNWSCGSQSKLKKEYFLDITPDRLVRLVSLQGFTFYVDMVFRYFWSRFFADINKNI